MRGIRDETGKDNLHYYLADLSSLDEVRRLADEIRSEHDRLDVLVNNAGIGAGKQGERRARTATNCASPSTTWRRF